MKLKLGKTSIVLITAGVIVIVFASLGFARVQQVREQERVSGELEIVNRRLNTLQIKDLQVQREELEAKLSETTSQSEAVKEILSRQLGSIDADDAVFEIAEICSVIVNGISSSSPSPVQLEGVPCSTITMNIGAVGDVPNLINFINRLNSDFVTGVVNSATLSIPDETSEQGPTAQINMTVYHYKGG